MGIINSEINESLKELEIENGNLRDLNRFDIYNGEALSFWGMVELNKGNNFLSIVPGNTNRLSVLSTDLLYNNEKIGISDIRRMIKDGVKVNRKILKTMVNENLNPEMMFIKDRRTGQFPQISQKEAKRRYNEYLNNLPPNYNDLEISSRKMMYDIKSNLVLLNSEKYTYSLAYINKLDNKNSIILNFTKEFILAKMEKENTYENYSDFLDIKGIIDLRNPDFVKVNLSIDSKTNNFLKTTGRRVLSSLTHTIDSNPDMLTIKEGIAEKNTEIRKILNFPNKVLSVNYRIGFIVDKEKEEVLKVHFADTVTLAFARAGDENDVLTFKVPDISDENSNQKWELIEKTQVPEDDIHEMVALMSDPSVDLIDKIIIPEKETDIFDSENRILFDKKDGKAIKEYNLKEIKSRKALEESRYKDTIGQFKIKI